MSKTRYRIVTDRYLGYEAQCKLWWFPFWIQMGYCNTHATIAKAEEYILRKVHGGFVKYVEL